MAAAKGWKAGKKIELATSAQITAWRERLDTEGKSQKVVNMAEIDKMIDKLDMKNTYLHQFKKEDVKEKELIEEQTCTHVNICLTVKRYIKFQYDMAKGDTEQNYCQKCKYESKWCKHRKEREVFKQKLGATLTT